MWPQNQNMTRSIHCFNSIKSDAAVRSQIGKRDFPRERLATPNDHVSIPGVELDQPHTVRGFIAGAVKKNLGLDVTSETVEGRARIIDQTTLHDAIPALSAIVSCSVSHLHSQHLSY